MTQIHKSRPSSHPYIDTVWQTKNIADGVYLATPDGSWDLIVLIDEHGHRQVMITGQATKPSQVPYKTGTGSVVIAFAPGAYMPLYPAEKLLDSFDILPNFDAEHFMLDGHKFAFPTFETAEALVDRLIALEILKNDEVIAGEVEGAPRAISERGKQRHFAQTTGMTKKYLDQIKRAQLAIRLLQEGKKPSEAAAEAGYTDQAHMAKSLKMIMSSKPSGVDHIHKL